MFNNFITNKWTSLACCLINSTLATMMWGQGLYGPSIVTVLGAFLCGFNFMIKVKEDHYDQDE